MAGHLVVHCIVAQDVPTNGGAPPDLVGPRPTNERIYEEVVDRQSNQSLDQLIAKCFQTESTLESLFGEDMTEFQLTKEKDSICQY